MNKSIEIGNSQILQLKQRAGSEI